MKLTENKTTIDAETLKKDTYAAVKNFAREAGVSDVSDKTKEELIDAIMETVNGKNKE